MPRRAKPILTLTALLIIPAFATPLEAQFPPDSFQNLQVLPEDITFRELIGTMRGFASALGVRCQYCHVGEANQPLSQFDFPSDEKATKRKARVMLRMLNHINNEYLADLPSRREPEIQVGCETCHRGQSRPIMTRDSLRFAYQNGGVDALETSYRELRTRYFGSHTHDFRWFLLRNLANEMAAAGNFADARNVMSLNLEFFPDNPRVQSAFALVSIEAAMTLEGPEAGRASYKNALTRFPPELLSDNGLNAMGYRLMGASKTLEAIEIFKINTELHPNSANAFDSLGEGYMNNGDTELAITSYEKSLELNPENSNAVTILERLRSN